MRIAPLYFFAWVGLLAFTVTPAWAFELTLTETLVDLAAHVIYNRVNGNIIVHSPGDLFNLFQIESRSGAFFPEYISRNCWELFTGCSAVKASHFEFDGFETYDFGGPDGDSPVLPSNLSADWIISDITADGSRLAGGKINTSPGGGPYLLIVPEPSGILLACCGLLGMSVGFRKVNRRSREAAFQKGLGA